MVWLCHVFSAIFVTFTFTLRFSVLNELDERYSMITKELPAQTLCLNPRDKISQVEMLLQSLDKPVPEYQCCLNEGILT